ncbi:MAG: AraC family transcriptional regulator [Sphingomonadaceae bacterium]|nr:AraC family transcriptional regulator [Sphingomonadaceae bacterium]
MSAQRSYRAIRAGVETLPPLNLARHYHREGYANVVLTGSFAEAAFAGRSVARPGDVLLHGSFDCHANFAISARGARVLRLPWSNDRIEGRYRVGNPDLLVKLAETDPLAASWALATMIEPVEAETMHWTDRLATTLAKAQATHLAHWSEANGLAPETVSRGFRRAFGASPQLFRLEARGRLAWRDVRRSSATLTAIAHDRGFADLAHMTRSITALTSANPTAWPVPRAGQLRSSAEAARVTQGD